MGNIMIGQRIYVTYIDLPATLGDFLHAVQGHVTFANNSLCMYEEQSAFLSELYSSAALIKQQNSQLGLER